MSSKVPCYLRALRLQWGLKQEEVASLLPKGDRNRVGDVELGVVQPNAQEILAYAVIFGLSAKEIFPRYYAEVEEIVMTRAYALSEKLKIDPSAEARRKQELITSMFARATNSPRAEGV
jgi:transcriptional regulator with XRE-family HTH domain